jgi:predicted MFS family arabinose efflux permease
VSIGSVVFLTILTHLSFAGGRVILSLAALHYGASPFTVGVVIALLAAIPMLFAVRWGRFVDRVGVHRPMLAGVCLMLAAMILAWAHPRLETLFVVSPLAGSGFVLFHIAVSQAAGAIGRPQERVRNFSLLALAFSTSNVLGPMLAGFAIDGIGHRHAFLALASGVLANAAVLAWRRVEIPRHEVPARPGEQRRLADLLRLPDLRRVFTASAALSMAWDLFTFVTPIYGTSIGLSASTIGLILGAFGAAVFAVRLVLPFVAHRVSEWRILVSATFATGATLFAFPLAGSAPFAAALAFVLGAGLGGTQPMIMTLLYARAPAGRGAEAVGVRTLLLNFSQTSVPLAFGALGSALGLLPVFWAMGAVLIGAGFYAARGAAGGR